MPDRQPGSKRMVRELVAEPCAIGEGRHRAALEDEAERGAAGLLDGPGLLPGVAVDRVGLAGEVGSERPEAVAGLDAAAGDPVGERAEHVAAEPVRIGAGAVPGPEQRDDAIRRARSKRAMPPPTSGRTTRRRSPAVELDRPHPPLQALSASTSRRRRSRFWPVMKRARSETRNRIASAMSSGLPRYFSAWWSSRNFS